MGKHSERNAVRDQTLEKLEGVTCGEPNYHSYLVTEIHRLRRVPIKQFRIEDFRILIGQSIGLKYLVPLALDHLVHHPLAQGDFYPGDLLRAVATVDEEYWRDCAGQRIKLVDALQSALPRLAKVRVPDDFELFVRSALARHRSATAPAV